MRFVIRLAIFFSGLASLASAAPITTLPLPGGYLDIAYSTGTGSKSAYYVVDFGATGGGKYAYEYKFDATNLSAADGLIAIDAAGVFNATLGNFGSVAAPDYFITGLSHAPDSDAPVYAAPDFRYWQYWQGTYAAGDVSWISAPIGISGRDFTTGDPIDFLTDGEFVGFRNSGDSVTPSLSVTAIPEPGTWAVLVGCGTLAVVFVRRRRVS